MKRKALILGTLGASFLLAGSVFAAYSVTDNADKQGFRISPGTISTDTVGSVTLEWGENDVTNVQNLAIGTPQTRHVVLKATTANNANNVYVGSLEVSIEDISGKAADAKKLIDYLTVEVKGYEYDSTDGFAATRSTLATLNKTNATETLSVHADKNGTQDVELVVSLGSSAQPYLSVINTDQVYLTVDWNKGVGDDDQSGTKRVYIPKPTGWTDLYVYSYSATGENSPWPGVKLTEKEGDNYIADLLDSHANFIFSDNGDNTKRYPADGESGMTRASMEIDTAGNIYFDWATHKFVAEATYPFYLVGEDGVWATLAANGLEPKDEDMGEGVDHQWHGVITVIANSDYKICSADKTTTWAGYSNIEEAARTLVTNSNDNFKFNAAGTYDLYLKHHTDGGYSVWIAAHSA